MARVGSIWCLDSDTAAQFLITAPPQGIAVGGFFRAEKDLCRFENRSVRIALAWSLSLDPYRFEQRPLQSTQAFEKNVV